MTAAEGRGPGSVAGVDPGLATAAPALPAGATVSPAPPVGAPVAAAPPAGPPTDPAGPVRPGPAPGSSARPGTPETAGILALIDRLEDLLEGSDLAELEVQAGDLGILLRKPGPLLPGGVTVQEAGPTAGTAQGSMASAAVPGASGAAHPAESRHHRVLAPLTGIYYSSPSPGAAPYIRVGGEIVVGQVVGLIEAMKLFNEIKSDAAGRVVRIVAEHGKLVKAKQPLVEIEPA